MTEDGAGGVADVSLADVWYFEGAGGNWCARPQLALGMRVLF